MWGHFGLGRERACHVVPVVSGCSRSCLPHVPPVLRQALSCPAVPTHDTLTIGLGQGHVCTCVDVLCIGAYWSLCVDVGMRVYLGHSHATASGVVAGVVAGNLWSYSPQL